MTTSTTRRLRPSSNSAGLWWGSHLGGRFLREAALVVVLYGLYKFGRTLSRDEVGAAFDNADQILSIERFLGFDNERSLQQLVLGNHGLVMLLNRYYATVHFPVTLGFLIFTYVRNPGLYPRIRWLFVLTTASGLLIHVLYPLAPPRLLPGYVDTITVYGPRIYSNASVTSQANQFAAMPSLHFAWAVLVAYGIIRGGPNRLRWLIVAHPVMTLAAIVLTANHYWLDAVLGGVLVVLSLLAYRFVESRSSGAQSGTIGSKGKGWRWIDGRSSSSPARESSSSAPVSG